MYFHVLMYFNGEKILVFCFFLIDINPHKSCNRFNANEISGGRLTFSHTIVESQELKLCISARNTSTLSYSTLIYIYL